MMKYEPPEWRTDLIIFTEFDKNVFGNDQFFLNHLNCSFNNIRKSPMDKPLCTLIHYVSNSIYFQINLNINKFGIIKI